MAEIRLIVRAAHILAATAWVGGNIFYMLVALPALRNRGPAPGVASQMATLFKRMVNLCMGVLLLTGAYLAFDRLSTTTLGWSYLVILGIKIIASLGMFTLSIYMGQSSIRRLAKRTTRLSKVAPRLSLAVGIFIFALGALLNALYEVAIAPH